MSQESSQHPCVPGGALGENRVGEEYFVIRPFETAERRGRNPNRRRVLGFDHTAAVEEGLRRHSAGKPGRPRWTGARGPFTTVGLLSARYSRFPEAVRGLPGQSPAT